MTSPKKQGLAIIVMGVASSGKSVVGQQLAQALNVKFIDGDDLHPRANIIKMGSGQPLNDEDRAPWLERIRDAVFSLEKKGETGVIVCSALKKKYRDAIRDGNEQIQFVFLDGDFDLILKRMQARQHHFMKPEMLQSQFNTLECPKQEADVFAMNIDNSIDAIVTQCVTHLRQQHAALVSVH